MQCEATAKRSKQRCRRSALPGHRYCCYHERIARIRNADENAEGERSPLPAGLEEEPLDLQVATALRGVDDEIAVLRVLIRRTFREGDVEGTRRGIETLCKALRVQYALAGRSAEGLASSLARVMDEVGNELGMVL